MAAASDRFHGHLASPPALVLLDVMLPYLMASTHQDDWRTRHVSHVPIIMLTAKSQEHNIVRALDHGANDYIVKPFRPGELLARIRRVTRSS
jgi:DNA-binding response OmpR family regulator